ncbi:CHAT domain-containing protein [Lentzea albidocapillata subsp. violacea]|uniref:CHAT domain-containing protein n=1 Tax=Lentzea albidocapillata subsp. violacea TaxID=128104 RepID=A0A1G8SDX8_9PSEU|nr:CHAT domain-containing protein [Lentzea albidocapillata]SDJ26955.1 CHAT domain-containing protein [Lentzea albidocapillata subsp. violacea]
MSSYAQVDALDVGEALARFLALRSPRRAMQLLEAYPALLTAPAGPAPAAPLARYRWMVLMAARRSGIAEAFDHFLYATGADEDEPGRADDELMSAGSTERIREVLEAYPGLAATTVAGRYGERAEAADNEHEAIMRDSRRHIAHLVFRLGVPLGLALAEFAQRMLRTEAAWDELEDVTDQESLEALLDLVGDFCSPETPLAERLELLTGRPELGRSDARQLLEAALSFEQPEEVRDAFDLALWTLTDYAQAVADGQDPVEAARDIVRSVGAGFVVTAATEVEARHRATEYVDVFGLDDPGAIRVVAEPDDPARVDEAGALLEQIGTRRFEYLADVLGALLDATTVPDARALVLDHPALLSPLATRMLEEQAEQVAQEPSMMAGEYAFLFQSRLRLLRECRELGIEAATLNLSVAYAERVARELMGDGPVIVIPPGSFNAVADEDAKSAAEMMAAGPAHREVAELSGRAVTVAELDRVLGNLAYALALTRPGGDVRITLLNDRAYVLRVRFGLTGTIADLDGAVADLEDARHARTDDPLLAANLGDVLVQRYEAGQNQNREDLGRAVLLLGEAVRDDEHPNHVRHLVSYAHALFDLAVAGNSPAEMNRCVEVLDEALALEPDEPAVRLGLGLALSTRGLAENDHDDLRRAVEFLRGVDDVLARLNLAVTLLDLGEPGEAEGLLRQVLDSSGPSSLPSSAEIGRRAATLLAQAAERRQDWPEAAAMYRRLLRGGWASGGSQLLRAHTEAELRRTTGLAARAALAFEAAGSPLEAAEVLERGRAVQISAALRLDSADLARAGASGDVVREFTALRQWLRDNERLEIGRRTAAAPAFRSLSTVRRKQDELAGVISRIRALPDLADFLTTPSTDTLFGELAQPLVYLAHASTGGLALIVRSPHDIVPIRLPGLTDDAVTPHVRRLAADPRAALDECTKWLWHTVMASVIEQLADVPHAVLVPTGLLGLLPLHAAWTPDRDRPTGRRYALDHLLLTYSPNTETLRASAGAAAQRTGRTAAAVDEPLPVSASPLPYSALECAAALDGIPDATTVRGGDATRSAALGVLRSQAFTHWSCHAYADAEDPLRSALLLAGDSELTIGDLLSHRAPEARLAVLSACETARIGDRLPDEVLGFPAALLQVGVPAVIGSLWSVPQAATAELMVHLYEGIRRGATFAHALRDAQRVVRDGTVREKLAVLGDVSELLLQPPGARPHAHAFHWAAFSFYGADGRR